MIKYNPKYPLKHLSVRVPWHDNKWNGTVCNAPSKNGACLILKNCAESRDDKYEVEMAGISLDVLQNEEKPLPPCIDERATFMSPADLYKDAAHPYIKSNPDTHGHLKPTRIQFSKFAAAAVPYNWMLKENAETKAEQYDINFRPEKEPQFTFKDNWIQEFNNQQGFLKCFFEHLKPKSSLVFFYAKQVPFIEQKGRVLVGVGLINSIKPSGEYLGSGNGGKLRTGYWEHIVKHSIREEGKNGFLLPYHEALAYQEKNPTFNPEQLAVVVPHENTFEFSYAAEHVGNITAIKVLLQCVQKMELAKELGIGENHDVAIQWLHDQIAIVQKLKGDYPGLGAALCALGIPLGHFVAAQLIHISEEGQNPWEKFEAAINNPNDKILPNEIQALINRRITKKYNRLKKKTDQSRINLLYLISRFDISQDQAKLLFVKEERDKIGHIEDAALLENPYLIYELTRLSTDPIDLDIIDMGVFIKKNYNGTLRPTLDFDNDGLDDRRVRALTIRLLENAALAGHTVVSRSEVIRTLRDMPLDVKCEVDTDDMEAMEDELDGKIELVETKEQNVAYQLKRFAECRTIIRKMVIERHQANVIDVEEDWETLLNQTINKPIENDHDELGRKEKTAALKSIATSRISVLIGGAGTGKTTLLIALGNQPTINQKGVLFLAPTGKARVRMQESAELHNTKIEAFTLAQFLHKYKRYRGLTMRYVLSDEYCDTYDTVIIDEASMMTEEMLATLFDCFSKGVQRIILVGDHRQLPPIGAGRPFLDIINYLKPTDLEQIFPKVQKGYAELTANFRQAGKRRADLKLANWFSGNPISVAADEVLTNMSEDKNNDNFRLVAWTDESDFITKFETVLVEELGLSSIEDISNFKRSLGSADGTYFNNTSKANYFKLEPSVNHVEDWQFLSPVREKTFGVRAINRYIHQLFRKQDIDNAKHRYSKVPKPFGVEEIIYGDKVINLQNRGVKKNGVYPEKPNAYIANGEIGIITGRFKGKKDKGKPKNIEIEFSSQKGYVYNFYANQFGEDANVPLELAYAITIHKSQGSEFKKVFLVIPDPCFLLSREMLYTALTRQKEKVILLYQGSAFKLLEYSKDKYSDALSRMTNLFEAPNMVEVATGKFLEEYLIHQASDGVLLRSKSELLIYQRLIDKDLSPQYERSLSIEDTTKFPDFTIDRRHINSKMYYWEHCGMMHNPDYRADWEAKKEWYRKNDILPIEEGGGKNGTLIISYDTPTTIHGQSRGAFSIQVVDDLIQQLLND